MKKIFSFMLALVAMCAMSMNAQTIEQPRFIDNTYFRLEGGVTAATHPHDLMYEDWGHSIQGVIGAEIGKWITPKFGVAFEGDFGIRNGSKIGYLQYEWLDLESGLAKETQSFNYITVTGLAKWHVNNTFAGYNPDRKWEVVLATGPMWIHAFPGENYINDFGVKFKAEVNYNVTNRLQINIIPEFNYNLTGLYSYGTTNHPRFDSRNSWYALKVGVTYKIGEKFRVCDKKYSQADIDALQDEVNALRARKADVVEVVREVPVTTTQTVESQYVVLFAKNSATLDANAKDVLNKVVGKVRVDAYASPEGDAAYNQKLSQERADVVTRYLQNRKVTVVQSVGNGVNGDSSNRVAIVTVQ